MRALVLGIGVQKAATSWLHAILAAHLDVSASKPKELNFFSYYFDHGYQWFERHFDDENPVWMECSPSYFIDPRAPARIKNYDHEAKIILMLRDPIERAYSHHLHEIIKSHTGTLAFQEGIKNNPLYLEQSLYGKHLQNWLEIFPRDQIMVIFQEDIKINSGKLIKVVYQFCNLDSEFVPAIAQENRNQSDQAKSKNLRMALRFMGDFLRRLGLENLLARIKNLKPIAWILRKNSTHLREIILPLSKDETEALHEYFLEDQKLLTKLLSKCTVYRP